MLKSLLTASLLMALPALAQTTQMGSAQTFTPPQVSAASLRPDPRVQPVARLNTAFNGVTIGTASSGAAGRTFLTFPRMDGSSDVRFGEITVGPDGGASVKPYPSASWNGWMPGQDASSAWVDANAARFGPDGSLWVVDTGMPAMGAALVKGGPKLVQLDAATNTVRRVYPLSEYAFQNSFIDDVRFGDRFAYLSDAGQPGLIVLDLKSGKARRVLDNAPQTTAQVPLSAEGHTLYGRNGQPVKLHADQLEVTPDGQYLKFQTASGPTYRIETRLLDDPAVSKAALERAATLFARNGATGGTAMDAAGNIYASDTNTYSVLKITPGGQVSTFVQDPRLIWVDAMWIGDDGFLYMPAGQLDRLGVFHGGVSQVQYPVTLYRVQTGQQPLRR